MELTSDLAFRLAEIQEALLALPDDAFAEKYALLKERDELREQATDYAHTLEAGKTDEDLLAELKALRAQMKALAKQKINMVSQAGDVGAGAIYSGGGGIDINAKMMEASGAEQIRDRIGRITGILTERGIETD
jgi:hypothetical protein